MAEILVRRIVVATELAEGSDAVVRTAAELAGGLDAELHAVHALEEQEHPFGDYGFSLIRLQRRLEEARSSVESQVARVAPPDLRLGSVKLDHLPAYEAIVRRAKEVDAQLIVVGPYRGLLRGNHLLGSTAQRVVQEAAVPCLVARAEVAWPWQSVLLPVGAEDVERGLLHTAVRWLAAIRKASSDGAPRDRCDVRVLHVVRSASDWREFSAPLARAIRDAGADPSVEAQLRLRRAVAWSRSVGEEIVRIADGSRVDAVAMGVCERGPLLHAALGSVSSTVIKRSSAPVVLFPPQLCQRTDQEAAVIPFPPTLVAR